jgi:nitroreductase
MEAIDVIRKRRSIRAYHKTRVPTRLLDEIIRMAQFAPSAGGLKSYKVFVTNERLIDIEAPTYIVVCAHPERSAKKYGERGRSLYAIQDATIVASYIQLLAVNAGLATVWVGAFKEGRVAKKLNLDPEYRPIVVLPIGFAAEEKPART